MLTLFEQKWVAEVRAALQEPLAETNRDFVQSFVGEDVSEAEAMSDKGLQFAFRLRDRYRGGYGLSLPDEQDWLLRPERIIDPAAQMGLLDDSICLAVMACQDPSPMLSLSAAIRLAPRAQHSSLVGELLRETAVETAHKEVRDCLEYGSEKGFEGHALQLMRKVADERFRDLRSACVRDLRELLRQLLDGAVDPQTFVMRFIALSEGNSIKVGVYESMVLTVLRSRTIQPLAKLTLLSNLARMPTSVRRQIAYLVRELSDDPSQKYLSDELASVVEQLRAQSAAAPKPAPTPQATDAPHAAGMRQTLREATGGRRPAIAEKVDRPSYSGPTIDQRLKELAIGDQSEAPQTGRGTASRSQQ
ncbi:hypothetical protein ACFOGJ_09285 [Marinibaculum pumilum]|uniref:DUF2336 domain-containing protein n=1 Tax=Marinibaculum pumilum TaxID=1766165 RepID=A0ABV7KYJ5_9PROT